jgi:large subunit ribosomal protein L9
MQVILLERVEKLGQMGDVVKVKDGFARNFLLPRKKALRATKDNLSRFEGQRAQLEATNLSLRKEAEGVASKVDGKSYVLIRSAGETGQLYGSVSTRDISDAVTKGGVTITRQQVLLDKPIKTIGIYTLRVQLHPEVRVAVTINVARNEDEAERQARGEVVIGTGEEEVVETAELFESEEAARAALGEEAAPQDGEAAAKPAKEPKAKAEPAEKPAKRAKADAEDKPEKAAKGKKAEASEDAEEKPTKGKGKK